MSISRTVLPCSRSVRQRSWISPSEKTALPAPMIAIVGPTFPPAFPVAKPATCMRSLPAIVLADCDVARLPPALLHCSNHQTAPDVALQDDVGNDRRQRGDEERG